MDFRSYNLADGHVQTNDLTLLGLVVQIHELLKFVFEDLNVEMGLHFSSSLLCKG
jgi:hypothetical protein